MTRDYTQHFWPLVDLICRAHHNSWSKGFWDEGQRAIHLKLCLMHSELSEAYEAIIGEGDNGDNFFEECADTVIRIADLTGWLNGALGPYSIYCGDEPVSREVTLLRAHLHISRAMEADRNNRPELIVPHLNQCVRVLFTHAALEGENLLNHIEEKMSRNKARPHMHGNKRY